MIQYHDSIPFTGEEHHVSLHKHPRSGKKFIPTAPSTKAMLVEEATGCKGPSRIFDKTSMKVGGVIDCELARLVESFQIPDVESAVDPPPWWEFQPIRHWRDDGLNFEGSDPALA